LDHQHWGECNFSGQVSERDCLVIAALSGNRYLEQSIRNFLAITGIFLIPYDLFYEMKENDKTAMNKRAIVKAIAAGDQDLAEEMMKQHIRDSWDLLDVECYEEITSFRLYGLFSIGRKPYHLHPGERGIRKINGMAAMKATAMPMKII
jgi:hypothetical protein